MTDERKLSSIRFVFTDGTTRVFNNVKDLILDTHALRMTIADHTYYTRVFLDKVIYFEEVMDDDSVTYYAENAIYTMSKEGGNA